MARPILLFLHSTIFDGTFKSSADEAKLIEVHPCVLLTGGTDYARRIRTAQHAQQHGTAQYSKHTQACNGMHIKVNAARIKGKRFTFPT